MKTNNENEKYTLHFIFHSTYQIFMDTCNEKNTKIIYQLVKRQET